MSPFLSYEYPICPGCQKMIMPAGTIYTSNTTAVNHCACVMRGRI